MSDQGYLLLYRFRYLFCSLIIVASLLILSILLSVISNSQVKASTGNDASSAYNTSYSDDPNVITEGFEAALNDASGATNATLAVVQGVNNDVKHAASTSVEAGASGGKFIAKGT